MGKAEACPISDLRTLGGSSRRPGDDRLLMRFGHSFLMACSGNSGPPSPRPEQHTDPFVTVIGVPAQLAIQEVNVTAITENEAINNVLSAIPDALVDNGRASLLPLIQIE